MTDETEKPVINLRDGSDQYDPTCPCTTCRALAMADMIRRDAKRMMGVGVEPLVVASALIMVGSEVAVKSEGEGVATKDDFLEGLIFDFRTCAELFAVDTGWIPYGQRPVWDLQNAPSTDTIQ